MDAHEYRYTARVRSAAWFMRLYLWMWFADIEQVDFCRLFWGYIFAIPNLLVRAFVFPFVLLFRGAKVLFGWLATGMDHLITLLGKVSKPSSSEPRSRQFASRPKPPPSKRKLRRRARRKEFSERFLDAASKTADRVIGLAQRIWPALRWVLLGFGVLFMLAVGALFGFLVYLLAITADVIAAAWWDAMVWLGGLAWHWKWLAPFMLLGVAGAVIGWIGVGRATHNARVKRAADKTGSGALSFAQAMQTGVKGVKSRTCPRIEIVE